VARFGVPLRAADATLGDMPHSVARDPYLSVAERCGCSILDQLEGTVVGTDSMAYLRNEWGGSLVAASAAATNWADIPASGLVRLGEWRPEIAPAAVREGLAPDFSFGFALGQYANTIPNLIVAPTMASFSFDAESETEAFNPRVVVLAKSLLESEAPPSIQGFWTPAVTLLSGSNVLTDWSEEWLSSYSELIAEVNARAKALALECAEIFVELGAKADRLMWALGWVRRLAARLTRAKRALVFHLHLVCEQFAWFSNHGPRAPDSPPNRASSVKSNAGVFRRLSLGH
jgi:hypothetical protein